MSDINPVNRQRARLNSQNNNAVNKGGSVSTFAKSAQKAQSSKVTEGKNAASLAQTLADTGERLDNPVKVKAYFSDPARNTAIRKEVEELVSSLNGDTSLDPIAYLPARSLSIVKGIMTIVSRNDDFRQIKPRY